MKIHTKPRRADEDVHVIVAQHTQSFFKSVNTFYIEFGRPSLKWWCAVEKWVYHSLNIVLDELLYPRTIGELKTHKNWTLLFDNHRNEKMHIVQSLPIDKQQIQNNMISEEFECVAVISFSDKWTANWKVVKWIVAKTAKQKW